jgi:uncharacterized protein YukE
VFLTVCIKVRLDIPHKYFTRSKAGAMAPSKSEDPMAQLIAKIEEGNRETHRRMETMQASMMNMEAMVKGVLKEHGEFQRWWQEVEKKVGETNEALIQFVIERQAQKQPEEAVPAPNGDASASVHLGTPSIETTHGQHRHRFVETNQRTGAGIETIRTLPPVGGTTFTPEKAKYDLRQLLKDRRIEVALCCFSRALPVSATGTSPSASHLRMRRSFLTS